MTTACDVMRRKSGHSCLCVAIQRDDLGALVSLEMGKIRTEGVGEVQEFVDIVRDVCHNLPNDKLTAL